MTYYDRIPEELQPYVPRPVNDSVVEGYSFKIVSEMEHSRGVAWVGRITKDGDVVCIAENDGHGGCNTYVRANDTLYANLVKDAKSAYPNDVEPLESFVQYIDVYSSSVVNP